MAEKAIVRKVSGNTAWVSVSLNEACATCSHSGLCGVDADKPENTIETTVTCPVEVGDEVEIEFPRGYRILFSFILFGIPVLFIFAGYFLGNNLFGNNNSESGGVIGALIGLTLSAFFVFIIHKISDGLFDKKPVIIRKH